MTHRWLGPHEGQPDEAWMPSPGGSSGAVAVEPLVKRLLWSRGYRDATSAATFRDASLHGLHDPSLLPDLDRAAERILGATAAGEPVVIYGDYDVDGISASAILFHALAAVAPGAKVATYVPHRVDEGYGLHAEALRELAAGGARVIVSVDCGVTAFEPAAALAGTGVDLIITDHHECDHDGRLPSAYAVVHPKRHGSAYPFEHLCGAGVAFKLAWRLMTMAHGGPKLPPERREVLLDLLALASLGTVADIVPLLGENRAIARHGLRRLRSTKIHGLSALIEASGLAGEDIDAERVGFTLGPRLNACGRMGHAKHAVAMLTVAPPDEAMSIAKELAKLNDQRRRTERKIFEEACAMAEAAGMTGPHKRAIVLACEGWHAGVVGIVCSRLIGRFHRPTILMNRDDGVCHGSGRSIDGFNLHAALVRCGDLLTGFGGHEMAAGMSLPADRLDEFAARFIEVVNQSVAVEALVPSLAIDCASSITELTPRAVEQVMDLGPFGRGNPSPRLLLRDVRVARGPEPMGAAGDHLSLFVAERDREMRLVGWHWGARRGELRAGMRIDAVVEPKLNVWNGRVRVEPTICDVAVRE
jgi:single-stranded-DNA-specific exonuclease